MLEGHLFAGNQALRPQLEYGVSVTDACLGWNDTEQALLTVARQMRAGH